MKEKSMNESSELIYKKFFSNVPWLNDIVYNTSPGKDYSFTFKGGDDKLKTLNEILEIDIPDDLYKEVIQGDGNPYDEITRVHSSSLAALLFFYNISEEAPITLELEGVKYIFNEVHFERKMRVIKKDSNMDVVLIGKSEKGDKTALFLESKFKEYIDYTGNCNNISFEYYKIYKDLNMFKEGTLSNMVSKKCFSDNKDCIELNQTKESQYCEGIKQIISHYIGIKNFIDDDKLKFKNDDGLALDPETKTILFGEVLFRFPKEIKEENFNDYKKAYSELAVAINAHSKNYIKNNEKFRMLPEILTYDQIFNGYELPKRIKELYQFK